MQDQSWQRFCDSMDRVHREQAKIKAENERMRLECQVIVARLMAKREVAQ